MMANPNLGDVLTYNGSAWVNQPSVQGPFGVGTTSPLGDLSVITPATLGAVLTLITAGFDTGELSNRSINLQQILSSTTANNLIMLNGTLGSSSAVGSPTLTSRYANAFGFESTDSFLAVLVAATGTNVTPIQAMTFDANGNVVIGAQAALATSATNGFGYIPTMAGAPTGTPTAFTGKVPLVYDTTNNKLWAYNGAWKGVALT